MLFGIKKNLSHPIFKGSAIVMIASLMVNIISYLYHLVAGRLLSPEQYGLLESLIALTYYLTVVSASFSYAIINALSRKKETKVWPLVSGLQKKAALASFGLWLVLLVLSPVLKSFLHISEGYVYFIFSLQGLLVFLPILYPAVLQSRLRFVPYSLLIVGQNAIRLLTAWFFLYLGWQAVGAYGGLLVQGLVGILLGLLIVRRFWQNNDKDELVFKLKKSFWSFLRLSFITNIALVSVYSMDILLVRHYFNSYDVGIYSVGAVLSKIIFFGASTILLAAFPLFSKYRDEVVKRNKVFFGALGYILLVCVGGVAVFKLFPDLLVRMLYGQNYREASQILFLMAIFMAAAALLHLLVQFLLALGKKQAAMLSILAALLQAVFIVGYHPNLPAVAISSTVGLGITLVIGIKIVGKVLYEKTI